MAFQFIKTERKPHRLDISLANPPVNILTGALMRELIELLRDNAKDESCRAVVIWGGEKGWSAGADVGEHLPDKYREMLDVFSELCELVRRYPIPTVAAVDGMCFGGGCEVACLCDFVMASKRAKFGQPEIKVGVFPPAACAHFARRVGLGHALEIVLTGDTYTAEQALEMMLVNRVVAVERFTEEVGEFVSKLTALSGPVLRLAKKATLEGLEHKPDKAARRVLEIYREELMETQDAVEGLTAFLEKRPPQWGDG